MDSKTFLDELLKASKDLANKGQGFAEDKFKIPKDGDNRDATIDGMKKGAVAVGVLALLLGTGAGRNIAGGALQIGSVAAVSGIAWLAYQRWVAERTANNEDVQDIIENAKVIPFDQLSDEEANERSKILLRAMIAAAKADGHIDKKEIAIMKEQIIELKLSDDVAKLLEEEMTKPLDVQEIADFAENQEMAAEIYLVSSIMTDKENSMEKEYLDTLARTMGVPDDLVEHLRAAKEEHVA